MQVKSLCWLEGYKLQRITQKVELKLVDLYSHPATNSHRVDSSIKGFNEISVKVQEDLQPTADNMDNLIGDKEASLHKQINLKFELI